MEETEENFDNLEYTEDVQETQEIQYTEDNINLADIHNDLSIIACFLIFFALIIILKYIYKFFNMVFHF